MKRIDRLLIKAKKEKQGSSGLYLAFIVKQQDGSWTATGHIKDRSGKAAEAIQSTHSTEEEAIAAINQLAELHPNKEDLVIITENFIDDEEDEGGE